MRILDRIAIGDYKASDLDLAMLRIIVSTYILVTLAQKWLYLSDAPGFVFAPPPGVPRLLPMPPSAMLLTTVNVAVVISASFLLIGFMPRLASIATSLSLILLNSIGFSIGKIDHGLLLVLLPIFMASTRWGNCFSVQSSMPLDARKLRHQPQLALFALTVALSMAYAGVAKLGTGWLSLDTQASFAHLAQNHYATGRHTFLSEFAISSWPAWLHELGDWATVIFELSLLPALLSPALFRTALVVAVAFHVSVLALYDIPFASNLFAYAAFAPLGMLVPDSLLIRWNSTAKIVLMVVVICLAIVVLSGDSPLCDRLGIPIKDVVIIGGSLLTGIFLVRESRQSLNRVRALSDSLEPPIVYFDGVCGVCNRWIDFVLSHDNEKRFRFAPLQSTIAQERVKDRVGVPDLDTIIVSGDNVLLFRSDAILAVLYEIGAFRWAIPLIGAIPSGLRDVAYDAFASVRYRFGGRTATCRIPSAAESELFYESASSATAMQNR